MGVAQRAGQPAGRNGVRPGVVADALVAWPERAVGAGSGGLGETGVPTHAVSHGAPAAIGCSSANRTDSTAQLRRTAGRSRTERGARPPPRSLTTSRRAAERASAGPGRPQAARSAPRTLGMGRVIEEKPDTVHSPIECHAPVARNKRPPLLTHP